MPRMKASEVLQRYARGERDFCRADLRGQSFKGQNLAGADFTDADLRSADFTDATLTGATFARASAGVQTRWWMGQIIVAFLLSTLLNFSSVFLNTVFSVFLFHSNFVERSMPISGVLVLIVNATVLFVIANQGFTAKAATTISLTFAVTVAVAVAAAVAATGGVTGAFFFVFAVAVAGAVTGAVTGFFSFVFAGAFTFTGAGAVVGAVAGAIAGVIAGAVTVGFGVTSAVTGTDAVAGAGAGALASFLLGVYCSRQALKGDEKFALLRSLGISFAAIGGTSFRGADLTGASFTNATLKSTNFHASKQRQTTLTHVCWQDAQHLDKARVGDSILANAAVRQLLVSRDGHGKDYIEANLRGANLNGVDLKGANLTGADLSYATLHRADLQHATLREVLAIGTDFTHASLTGACLESWNIDHTTKLDDVDCQYVFLLEQPNKLGSRERRPHDPDQLFAPGDFAKLYTKMINVVQVLLRDGMNRAAFAEAFQQLINEHPDISYDSIQAVERKGKDALVTLEVSETTDKAEVSRSLQSAYEEKVRQLEAKVEDLHQLRAADLKEVALAQKAQFFNQLVGGNAMNENTDQSRTVTVGDIGGNFNASGQALNLGELDISGQVSNLVNQLPSSPDPNQPGIKELLTQLQAAIEAASELSPEDKADGLEQVKVVAELSQNPQNPEKEGIWRKAVKILNAPIQIQKLPETATIVKALCCFSPARV